MKLEDIEMLVNAGENDSFSSWVSAKSYRTVLEEVRQNCPPGRHIMTLGDYIDLWRETVQGGSRACNEADVWARFEQDRKDDNPMSYVRHPFLSTVLVDTHLRNFSLREDPVWDRPKYYEAELVEGAQSQGKVYVPPTGKIYGVNQWGLPNKTGGKKTKESEDFEHRWWSFSSDQIRDTKDGINPNFEMALFGNGGTIGCFCELIKAHYSLDDAGGFYRILTLPSE
ncbi:hypothetical protein HYT23_02430 [Candidatus Pacearchaeota archaeon]|nr:hypothetical protein [Candidatus Pacearchaeota archaeon]